MAEVAADPAAPLTEQVHPQDLTEENSVEVLAEEVKSQDDEEVKSQDVVSGTEVLDRGFMEYGCSHYKRRCRIKAPCCNEIFDCRHCHNDAQDKMNPKLAHDVPRYEIAKVVCSLCDTEQEVRQFCINCGVCMGRYFCSHCKLYDDDTSKEHFHCTDCGICRVGGGENFFHCDNCRCCHANVLKDNHVCVEGVLHSNCPVCLDYLFETRLDVFILPCGHAMHVDCYKQMREHSQFACPFCSKSMCDMTKVWEMFDMQIAADPLPEAYRRKIRILCNDCGALSRVRFSLVGHKCPSCKSYNTRRT